MPSDAGNLTDAQSAAAAWCWGMEFPGRRARAAAVCARAFEPGCCVETSGPESEVVKLLPPLTITPEELDHGIGVLRAALLGR